MNNPKLEEGICKVLLETPEAKTRYYCLTFNESGSYTPYFYQLISAIKYAEKLGTDPLIAVREWALQMDAKLNGVADE
jgi:hypothetical protein